MKNSVARFDLFGMTAYSQSRFHEEPKKKGELPDDYDKRTYLSRLYVNDDGHLVVPMGGLLQCLQAGAQYSKKKIDGGRGATWTAKFRSGLSMLEDPVIHVVDSKTKKPRPAVVDDVVPYDGWMNADGVRGSGKRVMRRYPVVMPGWTAPVEVWIVDPIITESVFLEIAEAAGMFIGMGRWRPEKGGQNGRFKLINVEWEDNRDFEEAVRRAA